MFGIHRAVLRADPRIRSGLRMAPCCQSVSPRHYPPPTSPWWGALRAKVQELAPAPVQTTDQWARSRIDRATWVPEVPANPCSLSAALAARISSLVSPSVQQTGLYSGTHTHTPFPVSLTSFSPNPAVTHSWPSFSHHPPLSPWTWRQLHYLGCCLVWVSRNMVAVTVSSVLLKGQEAGSLVDTKSDRSVAHWF